ncbi:unnamed protein product, partial [Tetraodon nigroviridis]
DRRSPSGIYQRGRTEGQCHAHSRLCAAPERRKRVSNFHSL